MAKQRGQICIYTYAELYTYIYTHTYISVLPGQYMMNFTSDEVFQNQYGLDNQDQVN